MCDRFEHVCGTFQLFGGKFAEFHSN
jgi:hypothetical protein